MTTVHRQFSANARVAVFGSSLGYSACGGDADLPVDVMAAQGDRASRALVRAVRSQALPLGLLL